MSRSHETLWQQLVAEGLVQGPCPPAPAATSPWFVRVMLGFAGWIGASFLLMAVAAALPGLLARAGASVTLGVLLCAAAAALLRARPEQDFFGQFGFALSLAGQGLMLGGLTRLWHDDGVVAAIFGLWSVLLFALIRHHQHRVWSAACTAVALAFVLGDADLQELAPALIAAAAAAVWLQEFEHPRHGSLLRSAGYGLVLGLLLATAGASVAHGAWRDGSTAALAASSRLLGALLSGAVLVATVQVLLRREQASGRARTSLIAGSVLLAVAGLKAPGLAPALLVLLLGFAHGNRVLLGLGVAALLGYLSFYYYSLQFTLLQKSLLLAATGTGLLAARALLQRQWPETDHA